MSSPETAGCRLATATESDLPSLARLMARSPLLKRYAVQEEGAHRSLRRALDAGDLILVARRPQRAEPVGFAWLIFTRILNDGAYLRLLLVDEPAQGEGVGGRLMDEAEARARLAENHLYLLTTTDNDGARRFYERRGYRHVGDLPGLVRPEVDEALYHKELRPHAERLVV